MHGTFTIKESKGQRMEIKRGDSFSFFYKLTDASTPPVPLTGYATYMTSEMRDRANKLIDSFLIVETSTLGTYLCTAVIGSGEYPITTLYIDLKIIKDGITRHTDTFTVDIKASVTV